MRRTEQNKLNKSRKSENQYLQHTEVNGITLVSLVITIIVLLILAGVAINMAINSDGLFTKANEAVEGWDISRQEEQSQIGSLIDNLEEIAPTPVIISTELPEGWESSKVSQVAIAGNRQVPIPKGFTASQVEGENTISGGLVIYQGTDEVNSANHATALTTRNQFVWIPVDDINQMVMCKSNTDSSHCELKLIGGTLQCTNSSHAANKTNLCGRLYGVDSTTTDRTEPYKYTTNMNFADRSQTWTDNSGYREPDIVSTYDRDDATSGETYMTTAGVSDGTVATFSNQLTSDFMKMATSVAKYGGFYVGRYEAGDNGISQKNKKVLTATTSASESDNCLAGNMWYGLYNTLRNTTIVDKSIVSTHMIWRKPV